MKTRVEYFRSGLPAVKYCEEILLYKYLNKHFLKGLTLNSVQSRAKFCFQFSFLYAYFSGCLYDNFSQITVPSKAMIMAINRITILLAIINTTINIVIQTENTNLSMPYRWNKTHVISKWSKDLLCHQNVIRMEKDWCLLDLVPARIIYSSRKLLTC